VTEAIDGAVGRGVDVFILTGNEDQLKKEGDEYDVREDEKVRIMEHKKLLSGLAGRALVRTSPDFHAKYLLIDPNTMSQQGLFMTATSP
jgi:phosphatidylserine/phosphatidylglycerophosphate/cardiolipin synthase-like enzyme